MAHQYERTSIRKGQIIQAALEVIAERGLRSFTTRAIAERIGITDGSLFRHFKNKKEIVLAAMDQLERLMQKGNSEIKGDPLEKLEGFFRDRAQMIVGVGAVGRLVFSDQLLHAAGDEGRAKVIGWRARNLALVRTYLDELEATGALREGLEAKNVVRVVQGMLLSIVFDDTFVSRDLDEIDERIEAAWSTLVTMILKD